MNVKQEQQAIDSQVKVVQRDLTTAKHRSSIGNELDRIQAGNDVYRLRRELARLLGERWRLGATLNRRMR